MNSNKDIYFEDELKSQSFRWWQELGESNRLEIGQRYYGKTIVEIYLSENPAVALPSPTEELQQLKKDFKEKADEALSLNAGIGNHGAPTPSPSHEAEVRAKITFDKSDWDNFKVRFGHMSYQGLVSTEDIAKIIGEFEDKNLQT